MNNLVTLSLVLLMSPIVKANTLPESCGVGSYLNKIVVSTAAELKTALSKANPGDYIQLNPGSYKGRFVIDRGGSTLNPITLCGSKGAVLDGEDIKTGYTLHLKASYWRLFGFSITRGKNALILDQASYNLISNLSVSQTGNEAIHLRTHSSHNIIQNSEVSSTGLVKPEYGEGIYIGSAKSNWCTYTNCLEDRSDSNKILNNILKLNYAENIDIKEGTSFTEVIGNTFDGTSIKGVNYADSWLDIKGNDVLVKDNVGLNSGSILRDGYQTHVVLDGWGERIIFDNNRSQVRGVGYAIAIDKSKDVIVYCNNSFESATLGLSNFPCVEKPSESGTNVNIASLSAVSQAVGFREDHPVDNLFDRCMTDTADCSAGTNLSEEMLVEFDFRSLHRIGSVKLYGDAIGNWVSESFDIEYKVNASDAYSLYAQSVPARQNAWIRQETKGLKARFIRVRVRGAVGKGSVQARELEIWGRPADATEVTPGDGLPEEEEAGGDSGQLDEVLPLKASSSTYPGTQVKNYEVSYFSDQNYDVHAETKFDFFGISPKSKTKTPLVIYIHGGGFVSGDKSDSHGQAKNYLEKGIAYATINYRMLNSSAPEAGSTLLKPLQDSRRALQFIRHYADQLNIDSSQIILSGSSAGASTALWIAMQDEMKNALSRDPVLRQSTRVLAVAVSSTQSTLDIYRWGTDPEFKGLYAQGSSNGKRMLKYASIYYANTGTSFSSYDQLLEPSVHELRMRLDVLNMIDSSDPEVYAENTASASDVLHSYYHVDRLFNEVKLKGGKGIFKTPEQERVLPSGATKDSSLLNFIVRKFGIK